MAYEEHYSQIYPCSSQNSSFIIKTYLFPCPGVIMTFLSLVIYGISKTRSVSFDGILRVITGSSTEPYSISSDLAHLFRDCLIWHFISRNVFMTCTINISFFIKSFHCTREFCSKNIIILMIN